MNLRADKTQRQNTGTHTAKKKKPFQRAVKQSMFLVTSNRSQLTELSRKQIYPQDVRWPTDLLGKPKNQAWKTNRGREASSQNKNQN